MSSGYVSGLTHVSWHFLCRSDAKIFPEYIFPGLSMLPSDPEELVRVAYASNLCKLATSASSFLTRAQAAQYDSGAPGSPSKAVVGFLYGSMAHDDAGQLVGCSSQ